MTRCFDAGPSRPKTFDRPASTGRAARQGGNGRRGEAPFPFWDGMSRSQRLVLGAVGVPALPPLHSSLTGRWSFAPAGLPGGRVVTVPAASAARSPRTADPTGIVMSEPAQAEVASVRPGTNPPAWACATPTDRRRSVKAPTDAALSHGLDAGHRFQPMPNGRADARPATPWP